MKTIDKIGELLEENADKLLNFDSPKVPKDQLHVPGPDWVDRIFSTSDHPIDLCRYQVTLCGEIAKNSPVAIILQ